MSTWDKNAELDATEDRLVRLAATAEGRLHLLSKTLLGGKKPTPGPYAFFHQSSNSIEKLRTCQLILERLFRNRRRLTQLAVRERALLPEDWPAGIPFPAELQKVMAENHKCSEYMRLDFESLFMFAVILLEQWSLQAIIIGTLDLPGKHPFDELVRTLESGNGEALQALWDNQREGMLWLYYQVKHYRNKFIVHANRPWQRGATSAVYGDDFKLWTPTPPGWIDDDAVNAEIRELMPFAPEALQRAPDDYCEKARPRALIERIFGNIGNVPKREDRERIAEVFAVVGGSTPSFQAIAEKLFRFLSEGTAILTHIAESRLSEIDLGAPFAITSSRDIPPTMDLK
jgi:hypothetical protein